MKKIISALFCTLLLISGIAANENKVSFTAGLSSGIPFYGSKNINELNKSVKNPSRIIIGAFGTMNINIVEQGSLFLGADFLSDFIWNSDYHSNHIHFSMPLGLKFYPNLQGLCFGIAYMLGFRSDFLATEKKQINEIQAWGNGFKIITEYNFAKYGSSKHLPTLGFNWTFMPRGQQTYDNILTFYVGVNF